MLLIFRLVISLCRSSFRTRRALLLDYETHFRVLPIDSEFSAMNAARYFNFIELTVLECNIRNGFIRECFKRTWWPVGVAQNIFYLKPIKIFEKFSATTIVLGWDEKYYYRKFVFKKEGKLCSVAYQKSLIKGKKGFVKPAEVSAALGFDGESPPLDPAVLAMFARPAI